MSLLRENFSRKFTATGEVSPPPCPDKTLFAREVEEMKPLMGRILGVNVVDGPGGRVLMSSLGASIYMIQHGVEPILQQVVRDKNRVALQNDLISASIFEIDNVLSSAGDHPACPASDNPKSKPVYDMDSTTLIVMLKKLNEGKLWNGKDTNYENKNLNAKTNFFIGTGLSPTSSPLDGEIYKVKRKLIAGCDFFQTQGVFDIEPIINFLNLYEKTIGEKISDKILVGIVPIWSYGMMKYLLTLPGIVIGEKFRNDVNEARKKQKETGQKGLIEEIGVNLCVDLVDKIKGLGVKGVHIMPVGNLHAMKEILDKSGL